ncbi:LOW QUALITY PROTEIN: hypothetical protein Cgig2_016931 [Carnegiea gigantea]|uniref:Uncharacterized protein n=1 Tax=Carnegiea gigantea TaxID=171969 RepID=A0A9Q1GY06_9CARY|nr:LOW QUALITY PROTEIN: hypothetical protein Cgig2_016931 [Carnegiea gigantea]
MGWRKEQVTHKLRVEIRVQNLTEMNGLKMGPRLKEKSSDSKAEDHCIGLHKLGSLERDKVTIERESESGRVKEEEWRLRPHQEQRRPEQRQQHPNNRLQGPIQVQFEVFAMELRSGRKRLQSPVTPETSVRTSEESDPDYYSEETESAHKSSRDIEVIKSSSEHLKGEIRSKKRYDACCAEHENAVERGGNQVVGHGKGVEVKGKGKVEKVQKRSTIDEGEDRGPKRQREELMS